MPRRAGSSRHAVLFCALACLQLEGCGGGTEQGDVSALEPDAARADVGLEAGRPPRPGDPCVTRADCDDGSFCTGVEECIGSVCTSARNAACRDPGGCARAACDESASGCGFDPSEGRCTVGVCSLERGCQPLEGCSGDGDPKCDDARSCTDDLCLAGRCVHLPVDARCPAIGACGVGVCLGDSVADPAGCGGKPDAARCAPSEGCGMDFACHALPEGCGGDGDCRDDNLCDGVERCVGGRCVHGARATCAARSACEHASCSTSGVGDPWCRYDRLARCP